VPPRPPGHLRPARRMWTRAFAANAVCLQLHALAYIPATFMRTLAMPKTAEVVVADQPAGEVDQVRCGGRERRPLRHLPNGGGRGIAADVSGHLVAHRTAAGPVRRHEQEIGSDATTTAEVRPTRAEQHVSAPRPGQLPGWPFTAHEARDLPCRRRPQDGSWPHNHRESGECRIRWLRAGPISSA
jgi:hypothetical protein